MIVSDQDLETVVLEIKSGASPTLSAMFEERGAPNPFVLFDPSEGDLGESRLVTLLRYWNAMPRHGDLPHAVALDPTEITSALRIVMLLDVLDGGGDFKYLIYGEEIADRFGRNMVGKRTSEMPTPANVTALFLGGYRTVIRTRRPLLTEHAAPPSVSVTTWRRLVMPLADENGAVCRILVGNIPGTWRDLV